MLFLLLAVILVIYAIHGLFALLFHTEPIEELFEATPEPTYDPEEYQVYSWSRLSYDGDYYVYEDTGYSSLTGIDVSYAQGDIDWQKVKDDGIEFAVIRAGYRGYESGELHTDTGFYENLEEARSAGLKTAVYFFSQALNETEAEEEADYVMGLLEGYDNIEFIAYDFEEAHSDGRISQMKNEDITDCAKAFLLRVKENGYQPMMYGSQSFLWEEIDRLELNDITEYWMASYGKVKPEYPYRFAIWQYSEDARVEGISGPVDLDLWMIPK